MNVLVIEDDPTVGSFVKRGFEEQRWGVELRRVLSQREQLGVVNTYRDPSALGADRWAALLAARQHTQHDCAIVNCGTAVTIDVLTGEGVFAGGVIFPGLYLLRHSLDVGTAGVGSANGDDASRLAHSTADGVAAGTLFGLAGAIERMLLEYEYALSEPLEILLTGGDAPLLMSRLARPAVYVPDLVLKGVARAAQDAPSV